MPHSTLKATLLDRLHTQESDRSTRYILAQTPAASFATPALTVREVREVREGFTFAPCEFRTLHTAEGICTQAAVEVISPTLPTDRFIVMWSAEGWTCQCPKGRHEFGATVIAATQERIEMNRAARKAVN